MSRIVVHLADHTVTFTGRPLTDELFARAGDDDSYKNWNSRVGYTVYLTAEGKIALVVTGGDEEEDAVEIFDAIDELATARGDGMTPVPRSVYLAAKWALDNTGTEEPDI